MSKSVAQKLNQAELGPQLGGLLNAVTQANAEAVETWLNAWERVNLVENNGVVEVRNISAQVTAGDESYEESTPVMTLVEIPKPVFDEVSYEYTLNINSVQESKSSLDTDTSVAVDAKFKTPFVSGGAKISTNIGTHKENTRKDDVSGKLSVTAKIKNAPTSIGMLQFINRINNFANRVQQSQTPKTPAVKTPAPEISPNI